jgi:intracellular septation protein
MKPQTRKTILDFAPLALFFVAYKFAGLYAATATVIVACIASLGVGWWFDRKISPVPLFTAVIVAVLGGLTLYLQNATFIKMKPTIVYALLGFCLIGGELSDKSVMKHILGTTVRMDAAGCRGMAMRFGGFFLVMAAINELIWRNYSENFWVNYHTFGAMALTVLFAVSQAPFLAKHIAEEPPTDGN